ncbi:MAG: D-alanine--D-alanine ligase [Candidatus Doudnabacteria bacterium]|nr:D-alanine--D-alanine ligase [Candidatus Doudnabacteria bacterium]
MHIGVFFGSGSVEHDISIITANLVINGLKSLNHSVTPVYITKQGKWMLGEELGDLKLFSDPAKKVEDQKKYSEYYLDMQESVGKMVFKKKGLMGKSVAIDLAFPAMHGTLGEDGTLQGLFEMFRLPYVGCGVAASAVAMDKALTKIVMQYAGVRTTKFKVLFKNDWEKDSELEKSKVRELVFPVFVKPVHLGSSIGIGKAKDEKELEQKIEVAFFYDHKIVVEEAVENLMDVTCCVIGNNETDTQASNLQESVYTQDMFNFEDKYITDGGSQTGKAQNKMVIPARLNSELTKKIQDTAKVVYKAVECTGIARVDFLVNTKTNEFFANEINPMPGTLYHHLWKASSVELPDLLTNLINFSQEQYKEKQSVNFTFESSVLKGLGGSKGKLGKLG